MSTKPNCKINKCNSMHNNTLVIGLSQRTYPDVSANEIIMFGCLVNVRMDVCIAVEILPYGIF